MVDEINEPIDIVVQLFDNDDDDDNDEDDDVNDINNEKNNSMYCYYQDKNQSKEMKNDNKKGDNISIVRIPEYRLNARPLYCIEKNDIKIIRQKFKEQNRLLLNTYKTNAMYSCTINEFEEKISTFIAQTNAYSLIEELNETTNPDCVRKMLDNIVEKVTIILNNLLENQLITSMQYQEMKIQRRKVRLDYLFFLPDTRKDEVPVQPTMVSCESSIINIARLLNRLLEPIYDRVALKNTFFKSADAIQALDIYLKNNHLRSTTLFATLHINNILTIFPHEEIIQIVECFLHDNVPTKEIQGMSITTIMELIRFVLANQWFVYQNKLYRQISGGGSGIPLMSLLVNIILFDWQQEYVRHLENKNEIFGRCFDEIFLTWNKSQDELNTFIQTMNNKHSYIQIQSTIGTTIDYLDANIRHIGNENDHDIELETQVNHESKAEPYALPYIYDQPSDIYSKLIRAALIRAARCCSDIYEFQQERQYIQYSFIINNFSHRFIDEHMMVFFLEFNMEEFDHNMYDQKTYEELRENVIKYEQKCIEKKMQRHQQAQDYNLQYVSLSTNKSFFRNFKQYNRRRRHRKRSYDNRSKFDFEIIGRPKYPPNTK